MSKSIASPTTPIQLFNDSSLLQGGEGGRDLNLLATVASEHSKNKKQQFTSTSIQIEPINIQQITAPKKKSPIAFATLADVQFSLTPITPIKKLKLTIEKEEHLTKLVSIVMELLLLIYCLTNSEHLQAEQKIIDKNA